MPHALFACGGGARKEGILVNRVGEVQRETYLATPPRSGTNVGWGLSTRQRARAGAASAPPLCSKRGGGERNKGRGGSLSMRQRMRGEGEKEGRTALLRQRTNGGRCKRGEGGPRVEAPGGVTVVVVLRGMVASASSP
jgi:hypothetical protein